jgi:hypothetical protein
LLLLLLLLLLVGVYPRLSGETATCAWRGLLLLLLLIGVQACLSGKTGTGWSAAEEWVVG